jgi:recombination protein RecT
LDSPFIKHKPSLDPDPGQVVAAYSVATLKSGEKSREVMTVAQINKVRAISKAKDSGPWVAHYAEMCRKTVARRHSKVLPMSTDLDDLIRRDDALYDFEGKSDKENPPANAAPPRPQITARAFGERRDCA